MFSTLSSMVVKVQCRCILCCLLFFFPLFGLTQDIDFHWFKKGYEQNNRGEQEQAQLSFGRFLDTYPAAFPEAYFHRGYLYFHQKNYPAAIADFQRLYQLEPKSSEAPYALGRCYFQTFYFQKSVDYFTEAIQIEPFSAPAYNDRGMVLCQMRQFESALEDFYKATSLDTSFAMAYNNTGVARYFNQDIAKPTTKDLKIAYNWFSKAIERDPTLALAYRNRAAMNLFLKDYNAALQDLNRAEKLSPGDAMVFFYYGVVYADLGESQKASRAFEKTLTLNAHLPFAHEELGNLYKAQQQFQLAIQQYRLAQKARKNSSQLYSGLMEYRMALIYALQNRKSEMYTALKSARKAKVFSDMRVYLDVLKAKEFQTYRKEKPFKRFTKSIRKGKKDNKFLHPDLGWFRMRKE